LKGLLDGGPGNQFDSALPGPSIVIASKDAVILIGANSSSIYVKMPIRKDARTSEKPLIKMPPQTLFLKI